MPAAEVSAIHVRTVERMSGADAVCPTTSTAQLAAIMARQSADATCRQPRAIAAPDTRCERCGNVGMMQPDGRRMCASCAKHGTKWAAKGNNSSSKRGRIA